MDAKCLAPEAENAQLLKRSQSVADLKKYRSDPRLPLSREDSLRLVARLRQRANRQPGLPPELRKELRLRANQVAQARAALDRRNAKENRHPAHPTRQ